MPDFEYSAVTTEGKKVEGSLNAPSKREAILKLSSDGIYPLQLEKSKTKEALESGEKLSRRFLSRITRKDITFFYRQLATLIGTGIPILRSLNVIIEQCENQKLALILIDMRDEIQRGSTFSAAMARHSKYFSEMYVSLVRVGEATGKLDLMLSQMAAFAERDLEFISNVRTALAYPIFVLSFAALSIAFIMTFIMPRILKPIQKLAAALPWPTVVVLSIHNFLGRYGIFVLIGIIGIVIAVRRYLQKPEGKLKYDRLKISLPIIGDFMRKVALGQFVRSLGVLAKGGVPIIESLEIVKDVVGNEVIGASVSESIVRIKKGETIANGLAHSGQFPGLITQMIAVGEETGKLGDVLLKVADSQDFELNTAIKRLNAFLGPMIIIFVGTIIGFLVIAVLLPILGMSEHIS